MKYTILIKFGNGNSVAYYLSYFYVDKNLINVSEQVSQNINEPWVLPSKCRVHWDEKLQKLWMVINDDKRMAFLVFGIKMNLPEETVGVSQVPGKNSFTGKIDITL